MIHKYLAYLKTIETGSITQAAAELGLPRKALYDLALGKGTSDRVD